MKIMCLVGGRNAKNPLKLDTVETDHNRVTMGTGAMQLLVYNFRNLFDLNYRNLALTYNFSSPLRCFCQEGQTLTVCYWVLYPFFPKRKNLISSKLLTTLTAQKSWKERLGRIRTRCTGPYLWYFQFLFIKN